MLIYKGAVSSLDSEHACPSSQHANFATDASSGSGEGQLLSILGFNYSVHFCDGNLYDR